MLGNYPATLRKVMSDRKNWQEIQPEDAIEHCNFLFRPVNFGYSGYEKMNYRLREGGDLFVFNHFEVLKGICTKSGLIRSLRSYYENSKEARSSGYTVFDTTPTTFLICVGKEEGGINPFINRFKEIAKGYSRRERTPMKHCQENIWLVKPENANQGRGIQIFKNLKEIQSFLFSQPVANHTWVVQKYLEHPLLYKSRKFDIRIWCLVTNSFEIYIYKQGYLRTSSNDYSLLAKDNYVHLTNQCLQNKSELFEIHEEGNTLSFSDFQAYLDQTYPEFGIQIQKHFMPRIHDIVIDTFLSVRRNLNPNNRQGTFELFGFDFLIDEDFRVWLIEVNTNPYLGMPNTYMKQLMPKMTNDLIKLVVDPIYEPRYVPDPDQENGFQILYREEQACITKGKFPINVRRSFSLEYCYPLPQLKPIIGLPFIKKEQQSVLYGRARQGQKMINIAGINKNLLPKNEKGNVITDGDEINQIEIDYPIGQSKDDTSHIITRQSLNMKDLKPDQQKMKSVSNQKKDTIPNKVRQSFTFQSNSPNGSDKKSNQRKSKNKLAVQLILGKKQQQIVENSPYIHLDQQNPLNFGTAAMRRGQSTGKTSTTINQQIKKNQKNLIFTKKIEQSKQKEQSEKIQTFNRSRSLALNVQKAAQNQKQLINIKDEEQEEVRDYQAQQVSGLDSTNNESRKNNPSQNQIKRESTAGSQLQQSKVTLESVVVNTTLSKQKLNKLNQKQLPNATQKVLPLKPGNQINLPVLVERKDANNIIYEKHNEKSNKTRSSSTGGSNNMKPLFGKNQMPPITNQNYQQQKGDSKNKYQNSNHISRDADKIQLKQINEITKPNNDKPISLIKQKAVSQRIYDTEKQIQGLSKNKDFVKEKPTHSLAKTETIKIQESQLEDRIDEDHMTQSQELQNELIQQHLEIVEKMSIPAEATNIPEDICNEFGIIGTDRGFVTNGDNSKIEENISLDEDIKSDKNFVEVS